MAEPQVETTPQVEMTRFFTERGFGGRVGWGERPALVVIDMMRAFTDESLPLGTDQSAELDAITRLLAAFRSSGVPRLFVASSYDEPDFADAGLWIRKMQGIETLATGSPGAELDPRLARQDDEPIVVKKYASAFFGTDLVSRLTTRGVDTLVLTGCTTSGCVRATAVDAIQHGFRPIVVAEAVADRSKDAHDQSLFDLQAKYADVVGLAEVLDHLGSR